MIGGRVQGRFVDLACVLSDSCTRGHAGGVVGSLNREADGAAHGVTVLVREAVVDLHGDGFTILERLGGRLAVVQRKAPAAVGIGLEDAVVAEGDALAAQGGCDCAPGDGALAGCAVCTEAVAVACRWCHASVQLADLAVFGQCAAREALRHGDVVDDGDDDGALACAAALARNADVDAVLQGVVALTIRMGLRCL